MSRELIRTTAFARALRRLLKKRSYAAPDIRDTLEILAADAFDPRLKTHKLTGELAGMWACSAGYDLRVLFEFVDDEGEEAILLHSIGTHEEVY